MLTEKLDFPRFSILAEEKLLFGNWDEKQATERLLGDHNLASLRRLLLLQIISTILIFLFVNFLVLVGFDMMR